MSTDIFDCLPLRVPYDPPEPQPVPARQRLDGTLEPALVPEPSVSSERARAVDITAVLERLRRSRDRIHPTADELCLSAGHPDRDRSGNPVHDRPPASAVLLYHEDQTVQPLLRDLSFVLYGSGKVANYEPCRSRRNLDALLGVPPGYGTDHVGWLRRTLAATSEQVLHFSDVDLLEDSSLVWLLDLMVEYRQLDPPAPWTMPSIPFPPASIIASMPVPAGWLQYARTRLSLEASGRMTDNDAVTHLLRRLRPGVSTHRFGRLVTVFLVPDV